MPRRHSKAVSLKGYLVGGEAPISVQTMTNTDTRDVEATLSQIKRTEALGCDIVRVSCPDEDSGRALGRIVSETTLPVVADIHFNYKIALIAADSGASCLRINPGNIGDRGKVREVVAAARHHGLAMRIGVNAGSLERHLLEKYGEPCADALVESAMGHVHILEEENFTNFKISVKSSDVAMTVKAYEKLAKACTYPLHLGVTEAGGLRTGTVKSSMGLGALLLRGIGDTIRVSLSAPPEEEVKVAYEILKALRLRSYGINVISCPSCARQGYDVLKVVEGVERALGDVKDSVTVSILGCVVNGPGEAKHADVGFVGGGRDVHLIYRDGKPYERFRTSHTGDIVDRLVKEVRAVVKQRSSASRQKKGKAV